MIPIATCIDCGLKLTAGVLGVDACPNGGIQCATVAAPSPDGCTSGLYVKFPASSTTTIFAPNPDPTNPANKPAQLGCGINSDTAGKIVAQVDPSPCNAIKCNTAGLYVPCMDSLVGINSNPFVGFPLPFNAPGPNNDYNFPSVTVQMCNNDPDDCCPIAGRVSATFGGLQVTAQPGFFAVGIVEASLNGGPFNPAGPGTDLIVDNPPGQPIREFDFNGRVDNIFSSLVVGQCQTIQYRFRVHVFTGTGLLHTPGSADWEIQHNFAPVNCC